jgi:hypothetical protein
VAPQPSCKWLVLAAFAIAGAQSPAGQATQTLSVTATFQPRVSLQVSSRVLQFDVTDTTVPARATVEFTAGARAASSGEVRLVVDALQDVPGVLMIVGGSDGVAIGELQPETPTIAARWIGGGLRSGRLTLALRALTPGRYSVPVSLHLAIS